VTPSKRAVVVMVVLAACVRSVTSTTTDVGFDAGSDTVGEATAGDGHSLDASVPEDVWRFDVTFSAERPSDAAPMDVPAPDQDAATGGLCRGYVPSGFCTGGCGACVNAAAAGDCRAENDALQGDPQCAMAGYGFDLCFPSCVLGIDAGHSRCIDDYGARVRGCACYDRCVGILSPACQPRRRAFDRCVAAHCAACRS
jgi:hypothetical protein